MLILRRTVIQAEDGSSACQEPPTYHETEDSS
jgi:hypothetical protein